MVNVWVTEYRGVGEGNLGQLIPAKVWPAIKTTFLNFTGEDSSITLDAATKIVRIYADAIVYVDIDATADNESEPIPATTPTDRTVGRVNSDSVLHISDGS